MTSAVLSTPPGFENALAGLRNQQVTTRQNAAPLSKSQQHAADTAQDFEAMFISEMLSHMFEGIETDETFGGGKGEDVFRSMMTNEYGKLIAKNGGIGVSNQIMQTIISTQEAKGAQ